MLRISGGKSRPGHFKGVATIVTKLFNIIDPDKAYFGQKDVQQIIVIKQMAFDLNFSVAIREMPIVREFDGLAMSSRNAYLSKDERKRALCLYKSIRRAEDMIFTGHFRDDEVVDEIKKILVEADNILDLHSMGPVKEKTEKILVGVAAFIGKTRLIDNTVINKSIG